MELKMNATSLRGALVNGITGFFAGHLPARMKRLILLASVSGRLKEPETFSNETLAKLNKVMELSMRDTALMGPIQLSRAIWYGQTSTEIIQDDPNVVTSDEDRLVRAAHNIITKAPGWLRYGSEEEMLPDVIKLLRLQPSVLS